MDSCPVCYETFSSSTPETVGRKLPCEDVACTQCLGECFEEDNGGRKPEEPSGPGVRCPECLHLYPFASVEAVPTFDCEGGRGIDLLVSPDAELETTRESVDAESRPAADNANGENDNGPPSKLAAFLSTNRASSHVPADGPDAVDSEGVEDGDGGEGGEERKCSVDGCSNRAVQSVGVCPVHTKRASVVSVSAMVHKFKDTKLTSVALKSDKVEVSRGGVAGAGEAGFDPDAIGQRFRRQERLELGEAVALIEAVKNIFREEDNMVELDAPVMVVGDVHGQYFDLLNILKKWRPDHNLLFLGDYVDRGQFSCEVILHLFALKLQCRDKVFLIRGNHECSAVSAHFGFKDECKAKYGLTVYYRFLLAFQVKHLSDIENIDRFAEPEMEGPLCDILWADPMNEDDRHKLTDDEYRQFLDTDYVANQVRGCSYMFGYHAVQRFLRENRLMYMVRAHEVQEEGFRSHFPSPVWALAAAAAAAEQDGFTDEDSESGSEEEGESYDNDASHDHNSLWDHEHLLMLGQTHKVGSSSKKLKRALKSVLADTSRHLNPTVLTVFSAPNYCDRYRNKAAILHIEKLGYYTVNLLEAEPHPDPVCEKDMNVMQLLAMGNTCPYMPTSFREFLKVAVDLGRAVKPTNNSHGLDGSALPTPTGSASGGADSAWVGSMGAPRSSLAGGKSPRGETGEISAGEEGETQGDDEADDDDDADDFAKGVLLPSFGPNIRRGVSRMRSAPVLSSRRSSASSVRSNSSSVMDRSKTDPGARESTEQRPPSWDGGGVETPKETLCAPEDSGDGSRLSFLGDFYNSFSRRSMRASSPGRGLLLRQNTWAGGSPLGGASEHYRKAHARDGINEMHPEVLNRRISNQESEELEAAAAQVAAAEAQEADDARLSASAPSTASVSPAMTPTDASQQIETPSDESTEAVGQPVSRTSRVFGFGEQRAFSSALARADGGGESDVEEGGGNVVEPSPAPPTLGVRRQFSLNMNVGTPTSEKRVESRSSEELADILKNSSITELAEREGDVELEAPAPVDSNGPTEGTPRSSSEKLESFTTPSPRGPRGSTGSGSSPSPSQILFTHEEIVVLKLLFSLFDRKGKNFITRNDIIMYAEEGGDFAQLREVDACMEAVDADCDGKIGLSDYINFAARLKEIHSLQQLQDAAIHALEGFDGSPSELSCYRLSTD